MIIGSCIITIRLKGVKSLKGKRSQVKHLTNHATRNFNVAIAETGFQDIADMAELGMVVISNERRHVDSQLDKILLEFEKYCDPNMEIISCQREIF